MYMHVQAMTCGKVNSTTSATRNLQARRVREDSLPRLRVQAGGAVMSCWFKHAPGVDRVALAIAGFVHVAAGGAGI